MAKNRGLGKGLDALLKMNIQEETPEKSKILDQQTSIETKESNENKVLAGFTELPLNKIFPNPNQPRKEFDSESIDQLALSIKNFGMIQPITVAKADDHYEIIAGERRYRAAKQINLKFVPAIVKNLSQREKFEVSIVENIQRENLNPIEEALAFSSLIDTYQMTQDELAERIGKSRTALTNSIRLLNLDPQIQNWIIEGKITPGHARTILSLIDKNQHIPFANYIIQNNLSVREAEKISKKWNQESKKTEQKTKEKKQELEIKIAQEKLEQRLQTKVNINGSNDKGKIMIQYFSVDELERLLDLFEVKIN
ncbi:MAG: ParB/RepB/Spo0J family partition protein [Spirochaetes bacterium]|nr:ParB/RepB/Spo0J family partition protein [Spirochaetota bacterium]